MVVAVNRMPAADVEVSADLVRRLLAAQHPDLARLPVEFLANGWDNELYRVGDELVARLPRRAPGAQIIKNEQRWLPVLLERGALPAGRARGAGRLLRYGPGRGCGGRVPRRAARPGPGGRAGQSVPRCPAGRAGQHLRGQPRPAHRAGRPGRGAARVGGGASGWRRWRPPAMTGRRFGCMATCTRRTSWWTTARSAA